MAYVDFVTETHTSTKRDYLKRVLEHDKSLCAGIAKKFGKEYWDGDRHFGYGGYRYDGRWRPVAEKIADHYSLKKGDSVLDVGCGKGFLLYELGQVVPGLSIQGLDISQYAIENSKDEIREFVEVGNAVTLPYGDQSFDLVITLGTLHNLPIFDLHKALREIERVGKLHKYIMVESFRNEREKMNLLYWQLTCESFYRPEEWEWLFKECGYSGDHGYIFFE